MIEMQIVHDIEKMKSASEAKQAAIRILDNAKDDKKHPLKPTKYQYLIKRNIKQNSVIGVVTILYNMILSGEGLSTLTSKYQKKFA